VRAKPSAPADRSSARRGAESPAVSLQVYLPTPSGVGAFVDRSLGRVEERTAITYSGVTGLAAPTSRLGVLTLAESLYNVSDLSSVSLPLSVRLRLRAIRRNPQAGLLLYGQMRTAARSMSASRTVISIHEGPRRLCLCSPAYRLPKWEPLQAGTRELTFQAARRKTRSSFTRSISLQEGEVLVAICKPIETHLPSMNRQLADQWYLGTINTRH